MIAYSDPPFDLTYSGKPASSDSVPRCLEHAHSRLSLALEALRRFDDYYPYIRGMIATCGFRSCGIAYNWGTRQRGLSKATRYGLVDRAVNAIISFSHVPVRICLLGGLVLAGLSALYSLVQLALYIVAPRAGPGLPTSIVAQFFFAGANLFFLGVLGQYVNAIHSQVRKRPLVIEKETIDI